MRIVGTALFAFGLLLIAAAFVLWLVAVWTVGPNAGRYGMTGTLAFLSGAALAIAGAITIDEAR